VPRPKTLPVGADLAFAGYVEPGEAGYDALLTARDLMLERLLRARSQRAKEALAVEAACHGLVVEGEDGDDGGWAA
jgi:hypothetical protein